MAFQIAFIFSLFAALFNVAMWQDDLRCLAQNQRRVTATALILVWVWSAAIALHFLKGW